MYDSPIIHTVMLGDTVWAKRKSKWYAARIAWIGNKKYERTWTTVVFEGDGSSRARQLKDLRIRLLRRNGADKPTETHDEPLRMAAL